MVTLDATTAKNRFGEAIDMARKEPVMVTKSGRDAVVILSAEEYDRLQKLEDAQWVSRACQAEQSGWVGTEAAMAFLMQSPDQKSKSGPETH